ncbi:hypothetical protein [Rhodococcus sp. Leaf278]|uniref:hypothetical protein n=1 Tax=Rhodococcus sp. Leaf278 TaxID=1736319 RepID=UPI0012E39914|nr:hypothetical protein [Rhodococcus sp. Leaf278]
MTPPAPSSDTYYYEDQVGNLQVLLEEVTRARPGSPETRFVTPEDEVVKRLSSNFHHVLYGRRGTGKSSLLRQIESTRKASGQLVAWADQETFKGLSYPDVLVGTLAEVFTQISVQLRAQSPLEKKKIFRKAVPLTAQQNLADELDHAVRSLRELQKSPSESEIEWTENYLTESNVAHNGAIKTSAKAGPLAGTFDYSKGRSNKETSGKALAQRYSAKKSEHLERALSTYRTLMLAIGRASPNTFIILDDFYHLKQDDQPGIAGYFHRAVKDTGVWLKFGSIALWTRLYAGGNPPIGLQAPHDLRDLSLDRGLQEFKRSKKFLETILNRLCVECDVDPSSLFSDGALDRLVLAAGGVPRDYIGLVSESIASAKNRGPSGKSGSERIIAEDVNSASGRTVETKYTDMREDSGGASDELEGLVVRLTDHCRNTKSSCFLINASNRELIDKTNRLQNMRFVHTVAQNETVPNQQSDRYNVYVLDVSLLAAQRAWQVDFMGWVKREGRRARKLVYVPGVASITESAIASESAGSEVTQNDGSAVVESVE